jgi:ubiquinone/menaquinone biosynthesis C-methylase UbiE
VETDRLKAGMTWMWALGDYEQIDQRLMPHAEILAEAAGVCEGMAVLDVAAGNGNFAIGSSRRGATVIATDLTPPMVELGRARSEAEGLAIEWLEADAEDLPFETGRFDLSASVFGAMFAPQPERVAAELFRVVRLGGLAAMANYTDEGFLGEFSELLFRYGPTSPLPLSSPFLWGEADVVRQRFQGLASSIAVSRESMRLEFDSAEHALAFWEQTNGPFIALKSMVAPETYRELSEQALRLITDLNQADGDGIAVDSAYAQIVARKNVSNV